MSDLNLSFTPLLPWPVLALSAVLALAVFGLWLAARRRGAFLRGLGLALVLLALCDPSLVREDRESLKDVVAVVVDRSGSQTLGERMAQTDAARVALAQRLNSLGNIETRFIEAGDHVGGQDDNNDGTRLFAALNAGLVDVPAERIGAVFMITDGIVHDIPSDPATLGFKAPLHALITGHEGERDRRVELVEAPRFGLVGKDQTIEVKVIDTPQGHDPVVLRVRRDGDPVATLRARPGEKLQVPVRIEHGGPNVVELEVDALPDELTTINNKAVLTIEGVRDKLKVLLVSGEPHAGERMWRNLLKSDANVDLVHFTILRPPDKQDGTPINELSLIAFPTSDLFGRKINDFDLIVFDRYSNQSVLPTVYLDNIVRYVRDGGALLIAAGPDFARPEGLYYSPLGRITPARPDGDVTERPFRAAISAIGERHPVTRDLPGAPAPEQIAQQDKKQDQGKNQDKGSKNPRPADWSPWFRQINAEVTRGTNVLSGANHKPLLVLSREGKGRVGLLLSDQMWLWARGYEGGGPYQDLLRRLAHWLMKEPELEEEALRASVQGGSLQIERQSLKDLPKDKGANVTVTMPSGKQVILPLTPATPGLSRASLRTEELGLYRITDGTLSILANVGPENPREFQDVISTTEKLAPIVTATGGTVRRIGAGGEGQISLPRVISMREGLVYGGSDYTAVKRTGSSEVKGIGIAPLAIGFLGLAVLLSAFILTWVSEGRQRAGNRGT
ncbi:membrane protein [Beijerinckia indica]|uniref:Glutamine amidotransferase domain-containing protein n=1 Tax=Beijerinckia indica subsp. indica (strain ATCC 9039 / DSM 1715 / NCIMB 8712) TaxID=395963 RepID=B2IFD2_BEII9|nr:membrane protein [Beijerinckia indica]ACB97032.1 conserved hypothetical protein [Beijerinckia indica subsp. indica ATCC 9039]